MYITIVLQTLFSVAATFASPAIAPHLDLSTFAADQASTDSTTISGPILHASTGTWKSVIGTFTVPAASKLGSSPVSVWVGIDGDTCATSSLQTGVDFTASGSTVSSDIWYEWYPDYAYSLSGITFSVRDSVTLNITVTSKTTGIATITNKSKGTSVSKKITSNVALCEQDAEWLVEVLGSSTSTGSVGFTSGEAITNNGTIVYPKL